MLPHGVQYQFMTIRFSHKVVRHRLGRKGLGRFTPVVVNAMFDAGRGSRARRDRIGENGSGRGSEAPVSPFGGCLRLRDQYRQVGSALLDFEQEIYRGMLSGEVLRRDFAHAVAFVPVEVLESYLDDLLDLRVSDESLFFCRRSASLRLPLFLMVIGGATFCLTQVLESLPLPVVLGVAFLAGVVTTVALLPHTRPVRRFGAAKVVANEISRRRGHSQDDRGALATPNLLRELWQGRGAGAPHHLPPQPARVRLWQGH
jgi:hypothetical protein